MNKDLVCRLGELTKNEIQVICYLWICRNSETKICNPKRKTIMRETGLQAPNLSRAISGLEEKCWLAEEVNGNFVLFEGYQIDNLLNQKGVSSGISDPTSDNDLDVDKPKKQELSKDQKQDFMIGMRFLDEKIGKVSDAPAQGKALKWMLLEGATIDQIKAALIKQLREFSSNYRTSYLSVQKQIFNYIKNGALKVAIEKEIESHEDDDLDLTEEEDFITAEEKNTWQLILDPIQKNMNKQIYQSWFEPIRLEGIDQNEKVIRLKSTSVNKDWVENYYKDYLPEALINAGMGDYKIDWKTSENTRKI